MSTPENASKASPTGGANTTHLASKFQRKSKFRRPSVSQSQSETEYIPGISKSPGRVDAETSVSGTSADASSIPMASPQPDKPHTAGDLVDTQDKGSMANDSSTSTPMESETLASENGNDEDQPTELGSGSALHSPSLSPKANTKAQTLLSDSSQPATSPPESIKLDNTTDSVASSPRKPTDDIQPPPDLGLSPEPDIRPFSPEQLDQAKSLVLDLLGWGVEPEFLVTSGVSAEAIYRIFTDLNLRLPDNLEVSEDVKAVAYSWGPAPGAVGDPKMDLDSEVPKQPQPLPQTQAVD